MSLMRIAGQLFFGAFFGLLLRYTVADGDSWIAMGLGGVGAALGVWAVGNIGAEEVPLAPVLRHALGGAVISSAIQFSQLVKSADVLTHYFTPAVVLAVATAYNDRRVRVEAVGAFRKRGIIRRVLYLGLALSVFWSAVFVASYHHGEVVVDDERMKFSEVLHNVIDSPGFQEFLKTIQTFMDRVEHVGWEQAFDEILEELDVDGEIKAYRELGLKQGATLEEVRHAHRRLVLQYHPDKNPDGGQAVQDKFVQVQQAYETLQRVLKRKGGAEQATETTTTTTKTTTRTTTRKSTM